MDENCLVQNEPLLAVNHVPSLNLGQNSNFIIASRLAQSGIPVIPCCRLTKAPLIKGGFHAASMDRRQIESWWRKWPDALVGIPTAAFWVLDIDAKPTPKDSLAALLKVLRMDKTALAELCAVVVATPGGGWHLYFLRTLGLAIRTAAGDIAEGIDTRGHDAAGRATGYIIAPSCVLRDGRCYRVLKGSLEFLRTGLISEAPRGLSYLAHFSLRERKVIAADDRLKTAIRQVRPSVWRLVFETHQAKRQRTSKRLGSESADRMRRYAIAALNAEADSLSSRSDGRRNAVFLAACKLARFAAHGVLTLSEIDSHLMDAWEACGAAGKHGVAFGRGAIRRGLALGHSDALPELSKEAIGRGAQS